MNGIDLLSWFRTSRSEEAFTELVRRYANLVFSAAHRRLSNRALAEEVTQTVFIRLAKATPELRGEASLVAWLHRTTMHVAIDMCRTETRRQQREEKAAAMESPTNEAFPTNDETPQWLEIAPHLDEAMDLLKDEERQALLLRFFAQKRMAEVGQSLGVSEDAAKMRVNRALNRLREQLAQRGLTCTTTVLTGLLLAHSIEAAPIQLLSGLQSLHLSVPANITSDGFLLTQAKLGWGLAGVFGIGLGLMVLFRPSAAQDTRVLGNSNSISRVTPPLARPAGTPLTARIPSALAPARLTLQIIDAETEQALPNTRVVAVYFYAGGVPERHPLRTDADGRVAIPESNQAGDQGMNVFISAESHVPICLSWHDTVPAHRTIRLDPALTIAGTVVDESNHPVPHVAVEVRTPGRQGAGPEHVAFNGGNTEVITDSEGRWRCPYIPRDCETAKLILTAEGHAVTLVEIPMGTAGSTNATLIIKRGQTVIGRVMDSDQQPVGGASVAELHNWGYKKQATHTGDDGTYVLQGLWDPSGEAQVMLVVQANSLASQARTVRLLAPTNTFNFILAQGKHLRGRVTDEDGNPIRNATVRTDADNQGIRKYVWLDQTDSDGRFEWDSAPEESVLMWFEAPGYRTIRDLPLVADGSDHEIQLKR